MATTYRQFVLNNAEAIGGIERSLRSLSYILPGRFANADVLSEAGKFHSLRSSGWLYASVTLIGHYHDSILNKEAQRQQPQTQMSLFNKYTEANLERSPLIKKLSIALTLIKAFEVVAEMLASNMGGMKLRSKTIVTIETIKAAFRLLLFQLTGNRMELHSLLPDREYDPARLRPAEAISAGKWKGSRTGRERYEVAAISDNAGFERSMQFLTSRALVEPIVPPRELVQRTTGPRKWAEYLFILRPLIYVLAIKRFGARSYRPWLLSLVIELVAFSVSIDWRRHTFEASLTQLEKEEAKRRSYLFLLYLLRNPFYEQFTK
eukprot:jgi/Hompol1/7040/HPOL_001910-RA